ncbi:hypothetical protein [Parafrankia sp. BMG5.11]|uniref:hypothetical protein n=1 Tax=Parafrankia sp. BMG5.11 TaxID=222540 RepID=UPI0010402235|nr:hypothetical protein [Parafrankia sp. BMG5.11]TCJ41280.1 hypothetical protein E0504_01320 [Parafrankia sp. BMG5.11]
MSIEQTLARLSSMTSQQRDTLRKNAVEKLASGDPKWIDDAHKLLAALGDFDASQERIYSEGRRKQISALEAKSDAERIVVAFKLDPPSEIEAKLIGSLLEHPDSTCAELSSHMGWAPGDLGYGVWLGLLPADERPVAVGAYLFVRKSGVLSAFSLCSGEPTIRQFDTR